MGTKEGLGCVNFGAAFEGDTALAVCARLETAAARHPVLEVQKESCTRTAAVRTNRDIP